MQKNTKDSSLKKAIAKDLSDEKVKIDKSTAKIAKKKAVSSTTKKTTTTKTTSNDTAAKKAVAKSTVSKSSKAKSTSKVATKTTKVAKSKSSSKTTKKTTTSKTSKKTTKPQKAKVEVLEYYDLPYRYNQTVVKILAQTPTTLFVYWDISDEDRKNYIDKFGENFFENTVPVLIVHNKTMNYSFEIEVNDFANSWYFNVNDAKCDYEIELGRRAKGKAEVNLPNNYMFVTSSNVIEAPNNHILFEKNQKVLFFRNVKTNTTVSKDVSQFEFMKYAGRIYNVYDVYKEIYKHEELESLEKLSSSKV